MATLKECDRCKRKDKIITSDFVIDILILHDYTKIHIEADDIYYELCEKCQLDLKSFLSNLDVGGRIYDVRG